MDREEDPWWHDSKLYYIVIYICIFCWCNNAIMQEWMNRIIENGENLMMEVIEVVLIKCYSSTLWSIASLIYLQHSYKGHIYMHMYIYMQAHISLLLYTSQYELLNQIQTKSFFDQLKGDKLFLSQSSCYCLSIH